MLAYRFGNLPFAAQNEVSDGNQVALVVSELRGRQHMKNEAAHHRPRGLVPERFVGVVFHNHNGVCKAAGFVDGFFAVAGRDRASGLKLLR